MSKCAEQRQLKMDIQKEGNSYATFYGLVISTKKNSVIIHHLPSYQTRM